MADKYNAVEIEKKWQAKWESDKLYAVTENSPKPKWYALTMFPYTSGDLHIGHWYAMAPSDVFARFKRFQGFNVLHPMGFDAFGLPAENAAIKYGIHPKKWTLQNIDNMRKQLKSMGSIYDWDREVITCDPNYYKWTQWFFIKLFEKGLAYRTKAAVNWCPKCQVVLANEQVESGKCWRCETDVTRRNLDQWMFRITAYADELMEHKDIDWPERIQIMQKNWVGKSYGTEISFGLEHQSVAEKEIKVFTTRADTIYGVTFMVLAPEHPLVNKITTSAQKKLVDEYVARTRKFTEIERLSTEKEKDGVFTGAYAINRLTGEKVPIWIADYVLVSYGFGAVMGVPAHDERDFAFAQKYGIAIKVVIAAPDWDGKELTQAYIAPGKMVNSAQFNGLDNEKGIDAVAAYLETKGWGKKTVNYKMRDWLISRQRYWGAPIPMVHCPKCGIVPLPESELPLLLPEEAEFLPTGESPLKYNEKFVNTTCPKCGGPAKRETDTIDGFMCSSWYFLRYCSPHYKDGPFDPEKMQYWSPVDMYTGGAEHAVMHLLYARFFTKALRDMGIIPFGEPFKKLFNQGTVMSQGQKMSKSKGNVVNPDDFVNTVGVDTVRAYMMFLGPWEQGGEWFDTGMSGINRWLNRVWNLALEDYQPKAVSDTATRELLRVTHQTIRKVSEDMERLRLNTMISALMELTNYLMKVKEAGSVAAADFQSAVKSMIVLLAPTAPHLTEELWEKLGYGYSIHNTAWPKWDETLAREDEITLVVQVNGKLRDRINVPANITEATARELAQHNDKIKPFIEGKQLINVIYVPGRLVNIVVK
ncbi:MAG: leucine--tRNA ligase [Dehalococcoidales bacterium]|nr:leucine--tRNA ligase [Dehalococcoidales bacterium]